ncbi:MAG: phenylalanine--tRNA ligase subunit beta [Chloroflexota bacterium]
MKAPLRWLRDFVQLTLPVDELARRLTMSGTELERIEQTGAAWPGLVVGRILTVEKHPNADRLQLTTVNTGAATPARIVCGATNIAAGQTVPVALPGSTVGDMTIERRRVRGIESEGMLCSPRELGISEDHDGILILDDGPVPGTPLGEALGDTVLDLYITPNRPDCLSIRGIAREVAALTDQPLCRPEPQVKEAGPPVQEQVRIRVEAPDLCPRYAVRLVRGVTIGPSPDWLRRRLEAAGIRAINNVVDVSNYVMLEIGQPLHTFDFGQVRGGTVVVRRARPDETIRTLDNTDRALTSEMLLICDTERAIGVAGVMGGSDSEVSAGTTDVLIESASFAPAGIRRTAQALGLRSEASMRFERGIDPAYAGPALDRAAELIAQAAGGTVCQGVIDVYPQPEIARTLSLELTTLEALLGASYRPETVEQTLTALGYALTANGGRAWTVHVPSFRRDVTVVADLIEDVARIRGYDEITPTLPSSPPPATHANSWLTFEACLRSLLLELGLTETSNYPLTSKESMARLLASGQPATGASPLALLPSLRPDGLAAMLPQAITVRNPLSPEWSSLRLTLLDGLLRTLALNARHNDRVALFEIGRVYEPAEPGTLPQERRTLAVGLTGLEHSRSWQEPARPLDFWSLKGVVAGLLDRLAIQPIQWEAGTHPAFHPGRTAWLRLGAATVGVLGEVHPVCATAYGLTGRVYVAEVDIQSLAAYTELGVIEAPSRYPVVEQDLAVVVSTDTPSAAVTAVIRQSAGPLCRAVRLFDVYHGAQVSAGNQSLAFGLTFQAQDRTLTVEEVNQARDIIRVALAANLGATLRAG